MSDRIITKLIDEIEMHAAEAVESTANVFRRMVIERTSPNRRRTRRFTTVIYNPGDVEAFSGVVFPQNQRYDSTGTTTERIVKSAYLQNKETLLRVIEQHMKTSVSKIKTIKIEIGKA
jgi:hypothetical protein